MRVAIVAETFTPAMNGVVNSVLRVAEELVEGGHHVVVVAPSGVAFRTRSGLRVDVVCVPSMPVVGYRELRIARPGVDVRAILGELAPDVVHLASPAVLGWAAVRATSQLGIATVAVFQTDMAAFLRRYHLRLGNAAAWQLLRRLHNAAGLTLAPSTCSAYQLRRHGIAPVAVWSRGVDDQLFDPVRRDVQLRTRLLGDRVGRLLVGYVGRLAAEKRVELLAPLSRLPGVRLVVVGAGPRQAALQRLMPTATFLGHQSGVQLATTMASLDLLVHPGRDETFCQVIQEALCSGVPVIAAASGGPLDLVRHGVNGWLWAGDDPHLLAAQVAVISADPPGVSRVQARARASVGGRGWPVVTEQLVEHYQRATSAAQRQHVVVPIGHATDRAAS
jgi:phosphatidylinositol alpha 1,6-mannosyltransferase